MTYVDGYVIPVLAQNKDKYIEQANIAASVFKEHGVIEIYENWGDDVPEGEVT